jgi:hypothetical protein
MTQLFPTLGRIYPEPNEELKVTPFKEIYRSISNKSLDIKETDRKQCDNLQYSHEVTQRIIKLLQEQFVITNDMTAQVPDRSTSSLK